MSGSRQNKSAEKEKTKNKGRSQSLRQTSPSAAAMSEEEPPRREGDEEEAEDEFIRKRAEEINVKGRTFWPPSFFGIERQIPKRGSAMESTTVLLARLASDEKFRRSFKGLILIQNAKTNMLGQGKEKKAMSDSDWFAAAMDHWKRYWQEIVLEYGEDEKLALERFNENLEVLLQDNSKPAATSTVEAENSGEFAVDYEEEIEEVVEPTEEIDPSHLGASENSGKKPRKNKKNKQPVDSEEHISKETESLENFSVMTRTQWEELIKSNKPEAIRQFILLAETFEDYNKDFDGSKPGSNGKFFF